MTTRINIRQWLARKNGYPRIADVTLVEKTQRAVLVKGHGSVESPMFCLRCGLQLTHPVSQQVGIGPICCGHLGISWSADTSPEAVAALKASLIIATTFEGWLPFSQIEVDADALAACPDKAHEDKPETASFENMPIGSIGWVTLTDWIAGQKGIPANLKVKVKRTSAKAMLVKVTAATTPSGAEIEMKLEEWLPFSQIVEAEFKPPRVTKPRGVKITPIDRPTGPAPAIDSEYREFLDANPLPF